MKPIIGQFVVLLLFAGTVMAEVVNDACTDFGAFPAKERYSGPYAKPDVETSAAARRFRTVIARGYTGRPDFAGRFQVLSWGCGSNCHMFAFVDTKTGKVTFAPAAAALGAEYRMDSKLFILDPKPMIQENGADLYETAYYVWNDDSGELLLLKECAGRTDIGRSLLIE